MLSGLSVRAEWTHTSCLLLPEDEKTLQQRCFSRGCIGCLLSRSADAGQERKHSSKNEGGEVVVRTESHRERIPRPGTE